MAASIAGKSARIAAGPFPDKPQRRRGYALAFDYFCGHKSSLHSYHFQDIIVTKTAPNVKGGSVKYGKNSI
jgi:hypothetical protein